MLNGSILVFALMHPIEFVLVLPWRYERWTDQDAIYLLGLMIPFSWGVCKYCRFPWKEAYDGRSRTCDVYGTGSGNARRNHGKTGSFLIAFWIVGVFCVFSGYYFMEMKVSNMHFQKVGSWD